MKVSIVIPAYNEEGYIERTLAAVQALSYADKEIIVVDNNCTDTTAKIVGRFPGVMLVSEKRRGTQYARECGRLSATGDIIASLDADCIPPPDWIERALPYFDDPSVAAVSGVYDYYDGSVVFRYGSRLLQTYFYGALHRAFHLFIDRGSIMIGGNNFVRAKALKAIGGYNTSILFYGDDTDTARRISHVGKIRFTGTIVVKTSIRRFRKVGFIRTTWLYVINYLWITVRGKPLHPHSR